MGGFIFSILNSLINGLGSLLKTLTSILPPTPFKLVDFAPIAEYLPTLNYFIPISQIIGIGEAWLTAIAGFYIYQIVLRWIKAID